MSINVELSRPFIDLEAKAKPLSQGRNFFDSGILDVDLNRSGGNLIWRRDVRRAEAAFVDDIGCDFHAW
jgi:hypothetical protein